MGNCMRLALEMEKIIDIEVKLRNDPKEAAKDIAGLVRERRTYDQKSKKHIDRLTGKYIATLGVE